MSEQQQSSVEHFGGWLRYTICRLRCWRQEWGVGWSIATSHACDLCGGHRWGEVEYDETLKSWAKECSRCGTTQTAADPTGTITGSTPTLPVMTVDTGREGTIRS